MSSCRSCSHDRTSHEHFRSGTNCAECVCASFKRDWVAALRMRVGRRPVPATPVVPAPSRAA
jgi:hypothetical protein